jgi:hypothetical protein
MIGIILSFVCERKFFVYPGVLLYLHWNHLYTARLISNGTCLYQKFVLMEIVDLLGSKSAFLASTKVF